MVTTLISPERLMSLVDGIDPVDVANVTTLISPERLMSQQLL